MYSNQQDTPWDKSQDEDMLKVDWEATLFQNVTHSLELQLTWNASAMQPITVAVSEEDTDASTSKAFVVQQTPAPAGVSPAFVSAEVADSAAKGDGSDSNTTETVRPNRRTVKDILTTRGDAVVAVSVAAHMN
jgi:hypothetical protein